MPDYKKKKVRRVGRSKAPTRSADIPMQSYGKEKKTSGGDNIKVVKGKKLERRRRFRVLGLTAVLFAVAIVVLSVLLPAGLMENIKNLTSLVGMGSYPYELYGTQVLNSVSKGNYYYILTDTNLLAATNGGKIIYTESHGYSSPALCTSETRALVYDAGGTGLAVYNLSEQAAAVSVEGTVITATVCRSGAFAVAYETDSYASTVTVYDKKGNQVYEWNSAKELVNSISLSPSGQELVVGTVSVSAGRYSSAVSVFKFDSADPVFSKTYEDDTVLNIDASYRKGFAVLTGSRFSFINWKEYKSSDIDTELEPAMYRKGSGGTLLVYNRSGDRSDNKIILLSKKGEKVSEFDFDGTISDIALAHGHIYCISDTSVYMLDKQGNVMRTAECPYGSARLNVTGTYSVAAVTSGEVTLVELEQNGE